MDTSNKWLGSLLMEDEGMITYASWNMTQNEIIYSMHDLYMVVVMLALKIWRNCLIGKIFELKTNHKS
jgi:hypothetical protein